MGEILTRWAMKNKSMAHFPRITEVWFAPEQPLYLFTTLRLPDPSEIVAVLVLLNGTPGVAEMYIIFD